MWPVIATLLVLLILGTSICFLLIAVVNLFAYWFHFIGIISMSLTVLLLITGAYFTRYLQTDNETYSR